MRSSFSYAVQIAVGTQQQALAAHNRAGIETAVVAKLIMSQHLELWLGGEHVGAADTADGITAAVGDDGRGIELSRTRQTLLKDHFAGICLDAGGDAAVTNAIQVASVIDGRGYVRTGARAPQFMRFGNVSLASRANSHGAIRAAADFINHIVVRNEAAALGGRREGLGEPQKFAGRRVEPPDFFWNGD